MAAAATFTYNGSNEAVAHITGATIGRIYAFYAEDVDSSVDDVTAVATSFTITKDDIGGMTAGVNDIFAVYVRDRTTDEVVGISAFEDGETDEFVFAATWSYDGVDTVTVTFDSINAATYTLYLFDFDDTFQNTGVGTGGSIAISTVEGSPFTGSFAAQLYRDDGSFALTFSTRLFQEGVAGAGALGNPLAVDPVRTFAPNGVTGTTAVLEGSVNPEGVSSTAFFEYGLTTGYGTTTPAQAIGSGSDPVDVEQFVTGLRPGRTYHVRVVRNP